jgi:lactoylglutathione lyase
MDISKMPMPNEGMTVTFTLIVENVGRSREFYASVLGGEVAWEGNEEGMPAMVKLANTWVIINTGGGPTDDKPTVIAEPPADPDKLSAFMNLRVADIAKVYEEWRSKGAEFLTEPKDHANEIRAYIRDPDGYLVEVGQSKREALESM